MKNGIKVLILCGAMLSLVTTALAGNNFSKVGQRGPSLVTQFRALPENTVTCNPMFNCTVGNGKPSDDRITRSFTSTSSSKFNVEQKSEGEMLVGASGVGIEFKVRVSESRAIGQAYERVVSDTVTMDWNIPKYTKCRVETGKKMVEKRGYIETFKGPNVISSRYIKGIWSFGDYSEAKVLQYNYKG